LRVGSGNCAGRDRHVARLRAIADRTQPSAREPLDGELLRFE